MLANADPRPVAATLARALRSCGLEVPPPVVTGASYAIGGYCTALAPIRRRARPHGEGGRVPPSASLETAVWVMSARRETLGFGMRVLPPIVR